VRQTALRNQVTAGSGAIQSLNLPNGNAHGARGSFTRLGASAISPPAPAAAGASP
jgi:hypothetical protein